MFFDSWPNSALKASMSIPTTCSPLAAAVPAVDVPLVVPSQLKLSPSDGIACEKPVFPRCCWEPLSLATHPDPCINLSGSLLNDAAPMSTALWPPALAWCSVAIELSGGPAPEPPSGSDVVSSLARHRPDVRSRKVQATLRKARMGRTPARRVMEAPYTILLKSAPSGAGSGQAAGGA